MATTIMQEYTPGVNLRNSISFITSVLFPILSNTKLRGVVDTPEGCAAIQ